MNIWAWVEEYAEQAAERQDEVRLSLVQQVWDAMNLTHDNPDQCLAGLARGRAMAVEMGEDWWVLFCDHWTLQTLLFRKRRYAQARPLAVAAVAEAQKSQFADFPQRICLQEDIISVYQGIDPLGYDQEIGMALERMAADIHPDSSCFHCLQGMKTEFLRVRGQTDAAWEQALHACKTAALASDYHHAVCAYADLCQMAYRRSDWARLAQWGGVGDRFDGRGAEEVNIAELRLWQAVATDQAGDSAKALRQYRKAQSQARSLAVAPTDGFFDAWAAFCERRGNFRHALRARAAQLAVLEDSGRVYVQCRCLLERCRLLAASGLPYSEEEVQARELSALLRDPAPVLSALAGLAADVP